MGALCARRRLIEALKLERSSRYLCSKAFITFISKPHNDVLDLFLRPTAVYYAGKPHQQPIPPSVMIVTTKKGTAVVPPDLPRRESKDNRMHACMRAVWLNAAGPTTEVTCFFVPPTM